MNQDHRLFKAFERKDFFINNRVIITLSVFIWGICAYLTGFVSPLFSHDSLRELYTEGILGYAGMSTVEWKIALGRFIWPVYQSVFRLSGTTILPFWNGLVGLIWLSITAIMVTDLFNITRKRYIFLFCGIITCNLTVIATIGTYIGDFDANMFGVMLATLAVKEWRKHSGWSWLSVPCLALALGIYQSNISVFISFVIFISIIQLVNNNDHKAIVKDGLRGIVVVILSGILYLILAHLVSMICGIQLTASENGIAKIWDKDHFSIQDYFMNLLVAYKIWLNDLLLLDKGILSVINIILFILLGVNGILFLTSQTKPLNKFIVCILVAVLPLGMNIAGFLNGAAHLVMTYSFWLLYLLVLLLPDHISATHGKKAVGMIKKVSYCLILLLLIHNVKLANGVHLKKEIERQSTLSYMTRVVNFIDNIDGFDSQKNDVLFIGTPDIKTSDAYSSVSFISGARRTSMITKVDVYQNYFDYILQYPITTVSDDKREEILGKINENELGTFPSSNSYSWVDDTLIIRLQ